MNETTFQVNWSACNVRRCCLLIVYHDCCHYLLVKCLFDHDKLVSRWSNLHKLIRACLCSKSESSNFFWAFYLHRAAKRSFIRLLFDDAVSSSHTLICVTSKTFWWSRMMCHAHHYKRSKNSYDVRTLMLRNAILLSSCQACFAYFLIRIVCLLHEEFFSNKALRDQHVSHSWNARIVRTTQSSHFYDDSRTSHAIFDSSGWFSWFWAFDIDQLWEFVACKLFA
jgi:hypothetical protein